VILMVHGGGWAHGDKAMQAVVANKVAHWVPKGFIVVSANYRLVPAADPLQQARDLAAALATVQAKAPGWGGDPAKLILMGHSAGAHLVALLSASPGSASSHGARPWLGTVALDSAAYDVEAVMGGRHLGLYDQAFGADPVLWKASSPAAQLRAATAPLLAVCSSRRADSCRAARQFVRRASAFGTRAQVLEQDLTHKGINEELGSPGAYTEAVDAFLGGLDPAVAERLGR
jgi:acetyl esterase/lipase